jgi:hypothetical protein
MAKLPADDKAGSCLHVTLALSGRTEDHAQMTYLMVIMMVGLLAFLLSHL